MIRDPNEETQKSSSTNESYPLADEKTPLLTCMYGRSRELYTLTAFQDPKHASTSYQGSHAKRT